MCVITATELKQNLKKYMELSLTEDVIVKKNNKVLTMLTNPLKQDEEVDFDDAIAFLRGCLPPIDYEAVLDEREMKR